LRLVHSFLCCQVDIPNPHKAAFGQESVRSHVRALLLEKRKIDEHSAM
jgi:hypothetical protein